MPRNSENQRTAEGAADRGHVKKREKIDKSVKTSVSTILAQGEKMSRIVDNSRVYFPMGHFLKMPEQTPKKITTLLSR